MARPTSTADDLLRRFHEGYARGEPDACWLWTGAPSRNGYGRLACGGRRMIYVHRLALQVSLGRPLTSTESALHSCDVRLCVNPSHLRVGTQQDNIADAVTRDRMRKDACRRGHPRTPENVRESVDRRGYVHRCCRVCERDRRATVPVLDAAVVRLRARHLATSARRGRRTRP